MSESKQQRKKQSQGTSIKNGNGHSFALENIQILHESKCTKRKALSVTTTQTKLIAMAANLTGLTFVLQTNMEKESTYLDHNHIESLDFNPDSHTDGWSLVQGVYPTIVVSSFLSLLHFWMKCPPQVRHKSTFCKYTSQHYVSIHQTWKQIRCKWQVEEPLGIIDIQVIYSSKPSPISHMYSIFVQGIHRSCHHLQEQNMVKYTHWFMQ